MKRHLSFLMVMVVGIMLFFLDMGHGQGSPVYQVYGFAHLAFFMLMALGLSRLPAFSHRAFWFQFVLIMSAVLFVGGIIELIQPYFGRTAKWGDLGMNLLGGFGGMLFLAPSRRTLRRGVLAFAQFSCLALAVVLFYGPVTTLWDMRQASGQFPLLSDFETRLETRRWNSGEIENGIARHGEGSLRVSLDTQKYAGTTLKRSFGDWRGYSNFAFCLYNPDRDPLNITVSIRDEEHFRRGGEYHDRFNRGFVMEQGWNDVYIPVADIENAPLKRKLELNDLSEVVIFTVHPPAPRVMYLDYVRLIR
jgi:VanZ family protein